MSILLVVAKGIVYAQSLTVPIDTSGVWYTYKQDVRCLQCLLDEITRKEELAACYVEVESCHTNFDQTVTIVEKQRVENVNLREENHKFKGQRNGLGVAALVLLALSITFGTP